ncbi:MAG: hexokinase [Megasphaera sp.]|jgi:hexokinase|uniref:hexokinase n=1 Tax=Megasphaera sueciensis TaxID=349094 RepID=UPI003D05DA92|nr:hexokinase [Megasphaera sp.]MCI1822819.1 hexokinase [Megasphaera sp.]
MSEEYTHISKQFYWHDEQLKIFSDQFCHSLQDAMNGRPSSLSKLDACIGLPSGYEKGVYLALDWGGTNIRASRVRLIGKRCYIIEKQVARPLKSIGQYDFTSPDTDRETLFDFIADCVATVALPNCTYVLGHSFSFAVCQDHIRDARLLAWSKEIKVPHMKGRYINKLLQQALVRKGLTDIIPAALINDTTAALLASSYRGGASKVAAICGTGFNICFYDAAATHIYNIEAGNYNGGRQLKWDKEVDKASEKPGDHCLEKMVAGRYLCEVFRRTVMTYFDIADIPACTTEEMNALLHVADVQQLRFMMGRLWHRIIIQRDIERLKEMAVSIFIRSAQLTGAACSGVLRYLYPSGEIPEQTLAIEGSVIANVTGSIIMVQDAMRACLAVDDSGWTRPIPVKPLIVKDGPVIGAAVAAAMCVSS